MKGKLLTLLCLLATVAHADVMEYCVFKASFPIVLPNRTVTGAQALRAISKTDDPQPMFNARLANPGNSKYVQVNLERSESNSNTLDRLEELGIILPLRRIIIRSDKYGIPAVAIEELNEPPYDYYEVKLST